MGIVFVLVSEQKPGRREVPMVPAWKGTWERSCLCRDSGAGAQVAERAGTCAPSVRMWLLMAAGVEGREEGWVLQRLCDAAAPLQVPGGSELSTAITHFGF